MTLTNFYHAYCGGFEKQAKTLQEIQAWLDGKRRYCAGKELKVWKVTDCIVSRDPVIQGTVTANG